MSDRNDDSFSEHSSYEDLVDMIEDKMQKVSLSFDKRMDNMMSHIHQIQSLLAMFDSSKFSNNTSRKDEVPIGENKLKEVEIKVEKPLNNNNYKIKFEEEKVIRKSQRDEKSTKLNLRSRERDTNEESADESSSESDREGELTYVVREGFKVPTEDTLPFLGQKKLTIVRWCEIVSELCGSLKWSEEETLFVVRLRLNSEASTFWKTLSAHTRAKWRRVKKSLIQRFGDKVTGNVALRNTLKIEMSATEDLEAFILRFYKEIEATEVKFNEQILISLFINALQPKSLGNLVSRETDKFNSLTDAIQRTRAIWSAEKTNATTTTTTTTVNMVTQLTEKEINLLKRFSKSWRGGRRGRNFGYSNNYHNNSNRYENYKCHICNKFGHIKYNCPEKETGKETVAKK